MPAQSDDEGSDHDWYKDDDTEMEEAMESMKAAMEGYDIEDEDDNFKATTGHKITMCLCCLGLLTTISSILLVNVPGGGIVAEPSSVNYHALVNHPANFTHTTVHPPSNWQVSTLANLLGLDRQYKLQACILVLISFVCVWSSTTTSTHVAIFHPRLLPRDFVTKGTLSNASQDVAQPNGRLFTVSLFLAGMLNISSMYTFWIYRAWAPWYDPLLNPLGLPTFQCRMERRLRTLWVVLPNVGFMFTAAIPSLSDTRGYKFALMLVHNVLAPTSMACCIIMETIQLSFGENAFASFFSTEDATLAYGPLSRFQRARVVVVVLAWLCGVVFLGIQAYLGLGAVLGIRVKTCHLLALLSFYGEVGGMVMVALLPALAGIGTQWEEHISQGIMDQAWMQINEG